MKFLFVKLIELYQRTLSPDHGWMKAKFPYGYCKFYPSCSEYAKQAIIHKGVVAGTVTAIWRVARCNPWAHSRVDTISEN